MNDRAICKKCLNLLVLTACRDTASYTKEFYSCIYSKIIELNSNDPTLIILKCNKYKKRKNEKRKNKNADN